MTHHIKSALILAVSILALASCSQDTSKADHHAGTSPQSSSHDEDAFAHLLQTVTSFDFEPFKSPRDLLDAADIVVRGHVTSVADGRSEGDPKGAPSHFVVVGLTPDEMFKTDAGRTGKLVYFEVERPDNFSASTYQEALPKGSSILLFGFNHDKGTYQPVQDNYAGREVGSTIYAPSPQGLFQLTTDQSLVPAMVTTDDLGTAWADTLNMADMRRALD